MHCDECSRTEANNRVFAGAILLACIVILATCSIALNYWAANSSAARLERAILSIDPTERARIAEAHEARGRQRPSYFSEDRATYYTMSPGKLPADGDKIEIKLAASPPDNAPQAVPLPEQSKERPLERYSFPQKGGHLAELKSTVEKYMQSEEQRCSGAIRLKTQINIRSGPASTYAKRGVANAGTRHSVLLWADAEEKSTGTPVRWFLITGSDRRTVRGWISGKYADDSDVAY